MTRTAKSGGGDAILALARDLRHAERARAECLEKPIKLYNGATHQRRDRACEFLRALQKADGEYEVASQQALENYREAFEGSDEGTSL